MHLLNLSFLQFAAVFGSIAAVSVALYLLDRSRRKLVVSTLRFWVSSEQPTVAARRRRIQQPWSLILQLVSMALLLLAIAQLRFGAPGQAGRDHVIVLETSSWMAARSGGRTLMDAARQRARQYLRALPARDRVMLVRADALATPATAFEPDHRKVDAAIQASQPGFTALNLEQALGFARHIQAQDGRNIGEIAFIGTGRTLESDAAHDAGIRPPRNLRVLDFCGKFANDEHDRLILEQYRPYIIMMNCRAEASIHYNNKDYKPALGVVEKGMERIREFFAQFGQEEAFAKSNEVRVLKKFAREIRRKVPIDPLARLQLQLDKAIKTERYEDAAKLRDQIKRMQTPATK